MLKVGAQVGCDATALEKFRRPERGAPVSYWYSFEDLLALLHGRAPAKVDAVALHRRRVEHGHLSVSAGSSRHRQKIAAIPASATINQEQAKNRPLNCGNGLVHPAFALYVIASSKRGLRAGKVAIVVSQQYLFTCLQRTFPAGFIALCLPTKTTKLPSGSQWLHEIKHHPFPIIARKDGERVRLYSRPGNDLSPASR